jgi:hypothetical protein
LSEERAGRILFVPRALLGRQRAASILSQKCPKNFFNWFLRMVRFDYRTPGAYEGLARYARSSALSTCGRAYGFLLL